MVISLGDKIRNLDREMKENEILREELRLLEEANKAQGQERKELEKRIKKLEGEKSELETRISKQENKNKQPNDNLNELDSDQCVLLMEYIIEDALPESRGAEDTRRNYPKGDYALMLDIQIAGRKLFMIFSNAREFSAQYTNSALCLKSPKVLLPSIKSICPSQPYILGSSSVHG
ncbi:hypothetical protein SK128_007867 [Halocaridina rubra]|uniref:Uncharacterized protein n=1 Tax=Halocaridina rubra TaxID=373956 RepID=A0AAN9A9I6_HALRR